MKADIHPEYRPVVFQDTGANGWTFITRSTIETSDTIELDGTTYPLKKVDISAASHTYYTGKMKMVDTAGRVDRYNRRYAKG